VNQPVTIRCTVNGRSVEIAVPPMQRLLDVLRETCGLTGTKNGCGEGDCGACTVLIDGDAVVSCLVPVVHVDGADIRTVEDLADGDVPHPLQQAFLEYGGTQCGSCAPGFLMTAYAHLKRGGATNDAALCEALAGVLCRCTGYHRVIDAVQHAARGEEGHADNHLRPSGIHTG
jgi:carbon-monoxide dehydrogenase small subunit